MKKTIISLLLLTILIRFGSSAHYIIGIVNNPLDATSANGKTVILYNPLNGILDNTTDTVGPSGNSKTDNIYMMDCELLSSPCNIGSILTVKLQMDGEGYFSYEKNVTVTGAGYDICDNLTINSPQIIENMIIDDDLNSPENEIDLLPATTKEITCSGTITDYDGIDEINEINARFFGMTSSSYNEENDNNKHYTNNSCYLNKSYGNPIEGIATCTFYIEYYANSENWNCTINATSNNSVSKQNSKTTFINPLLAIGIDSPIDFGIMELNKVSNEVEANITNYGNVLINLTLNGYGEEEEDGFAMTCTDGEIPIYYKKYNLTNSNSGSQTIEQFNLNYTNLTSSPIIKSFNLNSRQDDLVNDANKSTYWRIFTPQTIAGSCSGNIIFGATIAQE